MGRERTQTPVASAARAREIRASRPPGPANKRSSTEHSKWSYSLGPGREAGIPPWLFAEDVDLEPIRTAKRAEMTRTYRPSSPGYRTLSLVIRMTDYSGSNLTDEEGVEASVAQCPAHNAIDKHRV